MRPLFIPLKAEYFHAFARGDKTVEYRRHGRGWNVVTCAPGRAVVLSHGYGQPRLTAIVESVEIMPASEGRGLEFYGPDAMIIAITLRDIRPMGD